MLHLRKWKLQQAFRVYYGLTWHLMFYMTKLFLFFCVWLMLYCWNSNSYIQHLFYNDTFYRKNNYNYQLNISFNESIIFLQMSVLLRLALANISPQKIETKWQAFTQPSSITLSGSEGTIFEANECYAPKRLFFQPIRCRWIYLLE